MSTFLATHLNLDKKISKIADLCGNSNIIYMLFFIAFLYEFYDFFCTVYTFLKRGMPESCINFSWRMLYHFKNNHMLLI